MTRVIVAGGGPAGMMAAITAARRGASVTLLEAMERTGKKLLLTGNGRCNLTHMDPCPEASCFGADRTFTGFAMRQLPPSGVRAFFEELGLLTFDRDGYVYPVTGQAGSVLAVLQTELSRLRVKVKCSEKIVSINRQDDIWQVRTASWTYECDRLILACGSKAAPQTGSDGSGYLLARMTGHRILPVFPALAPVLCREAFVKELAGVRCRASVSLYDGSGRVPDTRGAASLVRKETGELQWTAYGISGILVFQLSRFISAHSAPEKQLYLEIDLLPDTDATELCCLIRSRAAALGRERASVLMRGFFHEKLIRVLLRAASVPEKTDCQALLAGNLVQRLAETAKRLRLTPLGVRSFDVCQVCRGGVDTAQIQKETMESRIVPGLYFAGELMDVDGICGGYNLQWAWASGYAAGRAAAETV